MTNKQENTSTLDEVTERLQDFLRSKESENIVLTGAWGTGKTQAWKRVVNDLQREEENLFPFKMICFLHFLISPMTLGRKRYAYVSAADSASIKDLEDKIYASLVHYWRAGKPPTALRAFFRNGSWPLLGGAIFIALILFVYRLQFCTLDGSLKLAVPIMGAIIAGATAFFQLFFNFWQASQRSILLKDVIICIDDVERASKKLEPQEILHLAADLRDNKNCKVALILNPDQFYEEKAEASKDVDEKKSKEIKREFWQKTLEKGSDAHLELILDPKDAAKLAFSDKDGKEIQNKEDPLVKALRPQVIKLGINNVRIIQRIWNDLKRWTDLVKEVAKEPYLSEGALWEELALNTASFGQDFYENTGGAIDRGLSRLHWRGRKYREELQKLSDRNIKKGLVDRIKSKRLLQEIYKIYKSVAEEEELSADFQEKLEKYDKPLKLVEESRPSKSLKEDLQKAFQESFGLLETIVAARSERKVSELCELARQVKENKWAEELEKLRSERDGQKIIPEGVKKQYQLEDLVENIIKNSVSKLAEFLAIYQKWNQEELKEILDKYSSGKICQISCRYLFLYSYSLENKLDNINILHKFGTLLYPILKEYWDSEEIMNRALDKTLKDSRWQKLDKITIPSDEEIKK